MMMTEKQLIGKIRILRQIKPRKDWVLLTKKNVFGEEISRERVSVSSVFGALPRLLSYKPALVGVVSVFIFLGLFTSAQNALPGDFLYPIKKITEKSQAIFVSETNKPVFQLKLANERLEELAKIAQTDQVKKLAPAISEFQVSVSEAAKKLAEVKSTSQDIVNETQKIGENKEKVEKALAIKIGTEEFDEALSQFAKSQIEYFEGRTLTEEQASLLAEAKEDFEAGNYSQALEKVFILSYPQN